MTRRPIRPARDRGGAVAAVAAATPPRSPWRVSRLALVAGVAVAACTAPPPQPKPTPPPPNPASLSWRQLADAPSQRTEIAATAVGTRIVVAGGFRGDGGTVSTVEILDTSTGRWDRGPDLPLAVNHAMAATANGTAYVFGGYLPGGATSPAAFRLDPGGWQSVAQLPEGRAAGTAISVPETGRVYIAGGVGPSGLAERMLVFDVAGNTWAVADGPPTRREHLGGAGFDGLIYTVGGRTGAGNLGAFEVYDPDIDRWTSLPGLPTPRGGLAAAATCSGHVVAVGGEAQRTFPEVEAYDIRNRGWSALPPLPTPRHGLGVVVVGMTLYVLAGGPKPGLFVAGTAEAVDLAALGPCASNG